MRINIVELALQRGQLINSDGDVADGSGNEKSSDGSNVVAGTGVGAEKDAAAHESGIDRDGNYEWKSGDGSKTLRFDSDGSFDYRDTTVSDADDKENKAGTVGKSDGERSEGEQVDGTKNGATNDGANDGGANDGGANDGGANGNGSAGGGRAGIDLGDGLRTLDTEEIADAVERIEDTQSEAGAGVKFDGDGDGVNDDRVYVNELGGLTTVHSEGHREVVDINGNHGFRDEEGNVFQGNSDGTFIHIRADGTATWRTATETGETIRDEDGNLVSTATDPDGERRAVENPPSSLLTVPGLRQDGIMGKIDAGLRDGFISRETAMVLGLLSENDL